MTQRTGDGSDQGGPKDRLPPGQSLRRDHRALHYGPVPLFRPDRWDLRVLGATRSLGSYRWTWAEFTDMVEGTGTGASRSAPPGPALPRVETVSDFHCVMRFTEPDVRWSGVRAQDLVRLAPPSPEVTHVMAWGEYGYSANLRLDDFLDDGVLLATHRGGEPLRPEHGYPLRLVVPRLYGWKSVKWLRAIEYLTADRRGFWEERGYHNIADPWREQRYSHQEEPGHGPPL